LNDQDINLIAYQAEAREQIKETTRIINTLGKEAITGSSQRRTVTFSDQPVETAARLIDD
jgi:hypothetical protein